MVFYIGVDAGGTKTSAKVYNEMKSKVAETTTGPGNLSVNWDDALANIHSSIQGVISNLDKKNIKGIAIGAAGLPSEQSHTLKKEIEQAYSINTIVNTDYFLAFSSIFENNDGVLIVVGTGVVLYGRYKERTLKHGGWGHLLDDEGSSYDIVIRAIKHIIKKIETTGSSPTLATKLIEKLKIKTFEDIKKIIYNNEKSHIASLAPFIIEAAENGDNIAMDVVEEIVDIIYKKIENFKKCLGIKSEIGISMIGGVVTSQSILTKILLAKIREKDNYLKYAKAREPNVGAVYLLNQQKEFTKRYAVGLMSGTSLDGIDTVLCEVKGTDLETKIKVIDFKSYEFSKEIITKIEKIVSGEKLYLSDISEINVELGYEYSRAVKRICDKNNMKTKALDFIASHGQTVFHEATGNKNVKRSTMQLGEPAIIAYESQTKVVSNFRAKDMAAHGEGAPLVPKSELILYRDNTSKVLVNIGGITNITYLPKDGDVTKVIGYDTGPGNMMINEAMIKLYNQYYDDGGEIARKGNVIKPLLEELMNHWFISKRPPKSTGRDEFGKNYTLHMIKKYGDEKPEDIIRTLTEFTAQSITKHVIKIIKEGKEVDCLIVSGGGVHNKMLFSLLKKLLSDYSVEVLTQEEIGFSSDAKEAIAFVVLANQTLNKKTANVPPGTGAEKEVILGSITYPD